MAKLTLLTTQYGNALARLQDVLAQEKTEFMRDAAIQRFEFTFDLSWKLLKAYLEQEKGIICRSSKDCFREAYAQGVIEYDTQWLTLTDMRNRTSHIYNEKMADEIYASLPTALSLFDALQKAIIQHPTIKI